VKGTGIARLAFAALLALAIGAPAAPVPKELKVRSDVERMQGLWKEEAGSSHWHFKGDKLYAGGNATPDAGGYAYSLTVKPEASPPEFDLGGAGAFAGIYKFVGDDLHVAYVGSGAARPTDFTPVGGKHIHILKRVDGAKK
jgi:uncharacterized protein (TIGR03067 family)